MQETLNAWLGTSQSLSWATQVFIIVFATLLCGYLAKRGFAQLARQVEKTSNLWDDAFLSAVRHPARALIWLIGFSLALEITRDSADLDRDYLPLLSMIDPLREILIISIIGWFLIRFISCVERNLKQPGAVSKPVDETTVTALARLLRLSVMITVALIILQSMGYSISGVLAFGGIGGIAVGFAAKDLLANFFGGLMIYLDRPFSVGDWVRSPDRSIEGTVEDIGWRRTCIRTFDKRPLYVPNATFLTVALENPSRMSHRRIYETLGIRYEDNLKLQNIIASVKQMLCEHEQIDHSQTMIVNFNRFGDSSLEFFIYTFTHTTNWIEFHEVKQDVLFRVLGIIRQHGAEIAFPTQTLHVQVAPQIEAQN
jgi:MscS family membrane protein